MNRVENIYFYNFFHNGDIHVSRSYIRYIMSLDLADNYHYYIQPNVSPKLLSDIPNLNIHNDGRIQNFSNHSKSRYHKVDDGVAINTWYAVSPDFNTYSCTVNTLHSLFESVLEEVFDKDMFFESFEPEDFTPEIDFSKFQLSHINTTMNNDKFKVFISNCTPLSGQSHAGSMAPLINMLSDMYSNVLFYVTNNDDMVNKRDNVIFVSSISGVPRGESDLIENSYISTLCNIIVGKSSGPHTFTFVRENMMDPYKINIAFLESELISKFVLSDEIKWKNVWSKNYNTNNMFEVISHEIQDAMSTLPVFVSSVTESTLETFFSQNKYSTFRYYDNRPYSIIKNHIATHAMFVNGEMVAYGHLDNDGTDIWFGLCVAENHQGKGYGSLMTKKLLLCASVNNIDTIKLGVDKVNVVAHHIYTKHGFEMESDTDERYIMKLDIKGDSYV